MLALKEIRATQVLKVTKDFKVIRGIKETNPRLQVHRVIKEIRVHRVFSLFYLQTPHSIRLQSTELATTQTFSH
jgi:hypothetical protein